MPYLVLVSFDLKGSSPNDYSKVNTALSEISLERFLETNSKHRIEDLPNNTYAALYDVMDYENRDKLKDFLNENIKSIFKKLSLEGKYFIHISEKGEFITNSI